VIVLLLCALFAVSYAVHAGRNWLARRRSG